MLSGKLVTKLSHIPPYGKKLYGIEQDDGTLWHIWGTTQLVGYLAPVPFMAKVRLRYLGKGFESPSDKFEKKLFEFTLIELPDTSKKLDKRKKV